MWKLVKAIPALIYDLFISTFLTISAHVVALTQMNLNQGTFLDVGCGTGAPLKKIISTLHSHYNKIIGIDLDPAYTKKAQETFADDDKVTIYRMNFYNVGTQLKEKFNFIFFSFSFMLMPDQVNAIQVAKNSLQEDGKIGFLLTLNTRENLWLEKVKPLIKKLTTIDFGNVVYEKQFEEILSIGNLEVVKKVRIKQSLNPLLRVFPVYYVETKVKNDG